MAHRHDAKGLSGRVLPLICTTGLVIFTAGCGGDGGDAPAAESNRLTLTAGDPPSVEQCGFSELGSDESGSPAKTLPPPEPGTYKYETTGTESVPNEGTTKLGPVDEIVVTPDRTEGNLACFGFDRRYSPQTSISNVYIQRGEDTYITGVGLATSNYVTTIEPRPAILASAGSGTRWEGKFSGETSGGYEVEIIARKEISVGGESVEAVGLESRATYNGETEGSQIAETWLAVDRPLILADKGKLTIRVGSATNRIEYDSRLTSMTPETDGG